MRPICNVVLLLIWTSMTACGGDDSSDFSRAESERIFGVAANEMARLHGDTILGTDPVTFPYTEDCEEGGTMTMAQDGPIDDEGFARDLLHSFQDCGLKGLVFNGNLDYINLERGICNGESFGLDIVGDLTIGGELEGSCKVDAREECLEFTGDACGYELMN